MKINITITDGKKYKDGDFDQCIDIATKIHNDFAGDKDYIDSSILLNFEPAGDQPHQCTDQSSINLIFALEDCAHKKKALYLLQKATDEIVDGLSME